MWLWHHGWVKFNVALAPWMGGLFESLVGSFKRVLRKVILKVRLEYVEMLTILKKVENVLNNRPLSFVYCENVGTTYTKQVDLW